MAENSEMPDAEFTAAALQLQKIVTQLQQERAHTDKDNYLQDEAIGAVLADILGPLFETKEKVTIITRWLLQLGIKEVSTRFNKALAKIPRIK